MNGDAVGDRHEAAHAVVAATQHAQEIHLKQREGILEIVSVPFLPAGIEGFMLSLVAGAAAELTHSVKPGMRISGLDAVERLAPIAAAHDIPLLRILAAATGKTEHDVMQLVVRALELLSANKTLFDDLTNRIQAVREQIYDGAGAVIWRSGAVVTH